MTTILNLSKNKNLKKLELDYNNEKYKKKIMTTIFNLFKNKNLKKPELKLINNIQKNNLKKPELEFKNNEHYINEDYIKNDETYKKIITNTILNLSKNKNIQKKKLNLINNFEKPEIELLKVDKELINNFEKPEINLLKVEIDLINNFEKSEIELLKVDKKFKNNKDIIEMDEEIELDINEIRKEINKENKPNIPLFLILSSLI